MKVSTPSWWDGEQWVVGSTFALTRRQLLRIAKWLLEVQRQRRLGMPPSDRRDDLDRAIRALVDGKIVCGLADRGAGVVPFQSTQGTGKIITMGAH